MSSAGYSGTPLAKKLGIKTNTALRFINAPDYYFKLFTDFPPNTITVKDRRNKVDFIHYFETSFVTLKSEIPELKRQLQPNGMIWVSWYKKSAKKPTDITEDLIRSVALENGLVDVKVCAIDEMWSGLKLVIPVKDRGANG
ncbi:MAG: DUF3052 family protein [Bacteroidetes bacterium]|nr:DUF3052 family protein [Bacteroidota bacterium]